MPYNWNENYIPSKADKSTDILRQKEIGSVGQFIYYPFRYKYYILANDRDEYCTFPVCKPGYEPAFPSDDSVSGKGLLVSLCNLARQINDWNNKIPYDRLMISDAKKLCTLTALILCIKNLLKKGLILQDMMQNWQPAMAYFQSMTL